MLSSWARGVGLVLVLVLTGACTTIENERATDPSTTLDETVFKCKVEPILARQCSYPACHGNAGTALRVYTPGKLRIQPPHDLDASTAPLTDPEHHANFTSAAGFAYGNVAADDNLLLRKTTTSAAGGFSHLGGAIFGQGDAQYQVIKDWLTHKGACP